jgi:hypothetical protein
MWRVVVTDLSRFVFSSPDVQLIDGTLAALRAALPEREIQAGLDAIRSGNESAFCDSVRPLTRVTIAQVEPEDLELVGLFYAGILRNADGRARPPLYETATCVLEMAPESAPAFAEFAALVRADNKPLRAQLRAVLLARLPDGPDEWTAPQPTFPFLRVMERIVVVNVPHLYEMDALNERSSLCEDLNAFIPMALSDERFAGNERVKLIRETIESLDLPAYRNWGTLLADGQSIGKPRTDARSVDLERLDGVKLEIPDLFDDFVEEIEEQYEPTEEVAPPEVVLDFVTIGPEPFLPTMDVVNSIGQEFFESVLPKEAR